MHGAGGLRRRFECQREACHQAIHLNRLCREFLRGCRAFLCVGCTLLRDAVHLSNGSADLMHVLLLQLAGLRKLRNHAIDRLHAITNVAQLLLHFATNHRTTFSAAHGRFDQFRCLFRCVGRA